MTHLPNNGTFSKIWHLYENTKRAQKKWAENPKNLRSSPKKKILGLHPPQSPVWFTGGVSRWRISMGRCVLPMDPWMTDSKVGEKSRWTSKVVATKSPTYSPNGGEKWWFTMVESVKHHLERRKVNWDTLPETNSLPLDIGHSKRKGLPSNHNFSGGYVKLRGCNKEGWVEKTPMNGCVELICFLIFVDDFAVFWVLISRPLFWKIGLNFVIFDLDGSVTSRKSLGEWWN